MQFSILIFHSISVGREVHPRSSGYRGARARSGIARIGVHQLAHQRRPTIDEIGVDLVARAMNAFMDGLPKAK